MLKKLFGSREEQAFVREVSAEITKLRLESEKSFISAADERTFTLAAQLLTRAIAGGAFLLIGRLGPAEPLRGLS